MNKPIQFATLFLAASVAAAAQTKDRFYKISGNEWVQEVHGTLAPARTIKVFATLGSIRIQGGPQKNITYMAREHVRGVSEEAARRSLTRLKFTAGSGSMAWLKAECDGSSDRFTDFDIQVPAQITVRL